MKSRFLKTREIDLRAIFALIMCLVLTMSFGIGPFAGSADAQSLRKAKVQNNSRVQAKAKMVTPSVAAPQQTTRAVNTPTRPNVAPTPLEQPNGPDYMLSSNDKLKVTVFGEDDLSGEFVIDASGNISMPLIGEVRAVGLSLRALQRGIEGKLRAGYLVDPRVSAEMLNFRPFYVLGEVKNPGEYPFATGLTLLNAIAQAGGFTPLANTAGLGIKSEGQDDERRVPVRAGSPIFPGDTIRIDKAAVYILGEVKTPGEYPIPPGLNVVTAVAQAGGYTNLADTKAVYVKRAGSNEEIAAQVSTGQLVQAGDTLRVGKSSFFILGEVSKSGEYPLSESLTVTNAAALAGGFTYRADTRRIFIRRAGESEERPYRLTNDLPVRQGDTIRVAERFF